MDESANNSASSTEPSSSNGQVMDIQVKSAGSSPPASSQASNDAGDTPTTSATDNTTIPVSAPADPPADDTSTDSTSPSAQDSSPETSDEPEPAESTTGAENSEFTTPPTDSNSPAADNPLAIPPKPQHKGGKPIMVIVIAVIVALVLAGLVIAVYFKTKTKPAASTQSNTTAVVAKPQASPSDVDATNQQIDDSLSKTNDTKDFPATDLSDTSLGL